MRGLKSIVTACDCADSLTNIKDLTPEDYAYIADVSNSIKTRSNKKPALENKADVRAYITTIYKSLFGASSMAKVGEYRERQTKYGKVIKNKTTSLYDYNGEFLENVKFIETFRKIKPK
jgi:hypothetical protein